VSLKQTGFSFLLPTFRCRFTKQRLTSHSNSLYPFAFTYSAAYFSCRKDYTEKCLLIFNFSYPMIHSYHYPQTMRSIDFILSHNKVPEKILK